jgi:hypothetical protein
MTIIPANDDLATVENMIKRIKIPGSSGSAE